MACGRARGRSFGLAFALAALAWLALACGSRGGATDRPAAPELGLVDLEGRPLSLAAQRGQVVLLDFWATWCAPCRAEAPAMVALHEKYASRGLRLIGLSLDDDAAPVREFARAHALDYPLAMADLALAQRYGKVLGLPVKFLVDKQGRLVERLDGAEATARLPAKIEALLAE